jgi:hypothetical protein
MPPNWYHHIHGEIYFHCIALWFQKNYYIFALNRSKFEIVDFPKKVKVHSFKDGHILWICITLREIQLVHYMLPPPEK